MRIFKDLVYETIEFATLRRGVVRKFKGGEVRFPVKWCRYFKTDYEPGTFDFLANNLRTGDTFLDVGAHIGLFTVVASRLVGDEGKVVSFEPTPYTRQVLEQLVKLNMCDRNVEIRREAVSEQSGKTIFFDTGDKISVMNSLVRNEQSKGGYEVDTVSLDEFVENHSLKPSCIKVDVEGAELGLLRGGVQTLQTHRPKIMFSVHPPFIPNKEDSLEEIWSIIAGLGYSVELNGQELSKEVFMSTESLFDVNLLPNS